MPDFRKRNSRMHEEYIAKIYDGIRSPSSGASITHKGDVTTRDFVIECKTTGEPGNPAKSRDVRILEKVENEATEVLKKPALAKRYFMPDSPLANKDGWVDTITYLVLDEI